MIVILGAGMAGLSAAYHLNAAGVACRVFEKELTVGGLCRSYKHAGYTFDHTGHLLHFRKQDIQELVQRLLPDQLVRHARRSAVYSHGVYTDYPFQVNTYGLPPEVVRDCLLGFAETLRKRRRPAHPSFKQWIIENLGEGIARHFMVPFNEKLWRVPLEDMTADWVSWLVPKPALRDVINGALGIKDRAFGYNATFQYPSSGGIGVLAEAFLPHVKELECGKEALVIDTARRKVRFHDGSEAHFDRLISTMPVTELVARTTDLPKRLRDAAAKLRVTPIYAVNLAVERHAVSDKHWVYFPEPEFPFYRVGFQSNFAPHCAKPGTSTLYVEVSHDWQEPMDADRILGSVRRGLERAAILRAGEPFAAADVRDVPYAYVIYDRHRARVLPHLLEELAERRIYSVGRYGRWEHSSIEDAIVQGRQIAALMGTSEGRQGSAT
jgi:protoporphyrinogen oxidase